MDIGGCCSGCTAVGAVLGVAAVVGIVFLVIALI